MTYFLANYWHLILLIGLLIYGAFTLLRYVFDTRKEVYEIKKEMEVIESKIDNHINDAAKQKIELLAAIEEGVKRSKTHNENNLEGLKKFFKELGTVESAKTILGKK